MVTGELYLPCSSVKQKMCFIIENTGARLALCPDKADGTMLMPIKTITFFICAFCVLTAHADMYRWTDEAGKVHYTDKKPEKMDGVSTSELISKSRPFSVSEDIPLRPKPILKSYEKSVRKLQLLDSSYFWKKVENKNKSISIGTYYSGENCQENKEISVPEVYLTHKDFIPDERDLSRSAIRVIRSLEFEAESTTLYDIQNKLKSSGGLSLHSYVDALVLQACTDRRLYRENRKPDPIEDISASNFRSHIVKLSVRWVLKDNRDQDTIFEKVIDGYFDNLLGSPVRANLAIQKAMEDSASRLMADAEFVNLLYVSKDNVVVDSGHITSESAKRVAGERVRVIEYNFGDFSSLYRKDIKDVNAGKLLFGSDCSAARDITWGEIDNLGDHEKPKVDEIPKSIISEIRGLGYPVREGVSSAVGNRGGQESVILTASLHSLTVNMCAPTKNEATKYTHEGAFRSDFSRFTVSAEIKWAFQNSTASDSSNIFYTKGSGGNLVFNNRLQSALEESVEAAVNGLFVKQEVVNLLSLAGNVTTVKTPVSFSQEVESSPIPRPSELPIDKVILSLGSGKNEWTSVELEDNFIGYYGVGQDCHSYADRIWPDAYNDHEGFFPSHRQLVAVLGTSVMQGLDYPYTFLNEGSVLQQQRGNDNLRLDFEIVDLKTDACAPEIVDNGRNNVEYLIFNSSSRLKRHRVRLGINWKLKNVDQEVIYEKVTEGYADNWKFDVAGSQTFVDAFSGSAENLFSDKVFVDALTHKGVDLEGRSGGIFSKIYGWLNKEVF